MQSGPDGEASAPWVPEDAAPNYMPVASSYSSVPLDCAAYQNWKQQVQQQYNPENLVGVWQTDRGQYEILHGQQEGELLYKEVLPDNSVLIGWLQPSEGGLCTDWWQAEVRQGSNQLPGGGPPLGRFRVRIKGQYAQSQIVPAGSCDWEKEPQAFGTKVSNVPTSAAAPPVWSQHAVPPVPQPPGAPQPAPAAGAPGDSVAPPAPAPAPGNPQAPPTAVQAVAAPAAAPPPPPSQPPPATVVQQPIVVTDPRRLVEWLRLDPQFTCVRAAVLRRLVDSGQEYLGIRLERTSVEAAINEVMPKA